MKKLFALLLALTMVFALSACGEKPPANSDDNQLLEDLQDAVGGNNSGSETADNQETGDDENTGDYTQKQMEDTIVSYFSDISSLTSFTLCDGSSIAYSEADIPWQTVDIWDINDPSITYDELASLMSSQLTAAGFAEEKMSIGGYKWSIALGDKAMRIELRPEDWAEGAYEIYATPEAE